MPIGLSMHQLKLLQRLRDAKPDSNAEAALLEAIGSSATPGSPLSRAPSSPPKKTRAAAAAARADGPSEATDHVVSAYYFNRWQLLRSRAIAGRMQDVLGAMRELASQADG